MLIFMFTEPCETILMNRERMEDFFERKKGRLILVVAFHWEQFNKNRR